MFASEPSLFSIGSAFARAARSVAYLTQVDDLAYILFGLAKNLPLWAVQMALRVFDLCSNARLAWLKGIPLPRRGPAFTGKDWGAFPFFIRRSFKAVMRLGDSMCTSTIDVKFHMACPMHK